MRKSKNIKKTRIIIILSIIAVTAIIVTAVFISGIFPGNLHKAEKALTGSWLRSDGTYRIEISEVLADGKMVAKYYNPKSIHVGRSGWKFVDKQIQVIVELQDENYPGSVYTLTYDEETNILFGTYYQALYKQTYDVYFNQVK